MMAEYIDREKLLKEVEMKGRWGFSGTAIYKAIKEAPAADVVEVVRCKDCKCGEKDEGENVLSYFCRYDGCAWNYGNHFCGYGERRNDA